MRKYKKLSPLVMPSYTEAREEVLKGGGLKIEQLKKEYDEIYKPKENKMSMLGNLKERILTWAILIIAGVIIAIPLLILYANFFTIKQNALITQQTFQVIAQEFNKQNERIAVLETKPAKK